MLSIVRVQGNGGGEALPSSPQWNWAPDFHLCLLMCSLSEGYPRMQKEEDRSATWQKENHPQGDWNRQGCESARRLLRSLMLQPVRQSCSLKLGRQALTHLSGHSIAIQEPSKAASKPEAGSTFQAQLYHCQSYWKLGAWRIEGALGSQPARDLSSTT